MGNYLKTFNTVMQSLFIIIKVYHLSFFLKAKAKNIERLILRTVKILMKYNYYNHDFSTVAVYNEHTSLKKNK